jgi:hypothetical protein
MAENFTYNPAQSIKQEFGDISSGLGNIFKQAIEQKQRDYKLAEDVYTNIEALKDKVNMYGRQDITNKANQLVGGLADAIGPDGKINHAAIAAVTARVSRIKQEKQAWEDKAEMRKEYQTRLLSQKDLVSDMSKAMMDLDKVTMDSNILNPKDASKYFDKAFRDNLNEKQLFQKSYLAHVRQEGPINGILKDPKDKSAITFSGKGYLGDSYDPITKKRIRPEMTPVVDPMSGATVMRPTADVEYEKMEAASPETIDLLVERAGAAGQMIPENQRRKAIFNMAAEQLPFNVKETYVKPPAVKKGTSGSSGGTEQFGGSLYKNTIPGAGDVNTFSLGKNLKIKIGATTQAITSELSRASDGSYWATILVDDKGDPWQDENNIQGATTTYKKVGLRQDQLKSIFAATAANSYSGKLKAAAVDLFNKLTPPKGVTPPKPKPAANVPAPPKNPTAIAFKTKAGKNWTENMVYQTMKAGGFKETREQVISRLSK